MSGIEYSVRFKLENNNQLSLSIPNRSLVTKSILLPTVRALPGDGIAGHTPYVFLHTVLADIETATASPAKGKFLAAAVANMLEHFATFSPVGRFCTWVFHPCRFVALLVCSTVERDRSNSFYS